MNPLAIALMLVVFALVISLVNTMYFTESELKLFWLSVLIFIGLLITMLIRGLA